MAHSVATGLIAYLLMSYGGAPFGALIYALWVGNFFALRLMLTEPLCFAFAIGAIVAYQHKRYRWTMFLLILSTLTKELGLVVAAGLGLHAILDGRRHWGILMDKPIRKRLAQEV